MPPRLPSDDRLDRPDPAFSLHALSAVVPLRTLASFLRHRSCIVIIVILHARQRGSNQLAVGEVILLEGFTVVYGIHNFLHRGATSGTRVRAN